MVAPAPPAVTEQDAVERFRRDHPGLALPPVLVVVPAYEEAGTVGAVVAAVPPAMAGLETAVLVVDDGSRDDTGARASSAGALVCRLPVNSGQGAALRTGYRIAVDHGARFIATLDADGQWAGADLPRLVEVVSSGQADLVSGTRRAGDHQDPERWTVRGAGVVVFAGLIRLLTGARVTDPANGLRVMTAEVAAGVELEQPQFQAAELLVSAVCRGFRYTEIPVSHARRSSGTSKKGGSLSYGWRFSRALVGTWWRERRRSR
ncbi:MAG TPA: glycosyltransferase family 2 protein [Acidimicrobiales bacterium]|nr:glycosyltransferase family 2 protein [Acidimicrobiales bacterium]